MKISSCSLRTPVNQTSRMTCCQTSCRARLIFTWDMFDNGSTDCISVQLQKSPLFTSCLDERMRVWMICICITLHDRPEDMASSVKYSIWELLLCFRRVSWESARDYTHIETYLENALLAPWMNSPSISFWRPHFRRMSECVLFYNPCWIISSCGFGAKTSIDLINYMCACYLSQTSKTLNQFC